MFSQYIHADAAKFNVITNVLGGFVHISDPVGAAVSDDDLLKQSRILDLLPAGIQLLLDRGYVSTSAEASRQTITVRQPAWKDSGYSRLSGQDARLTARIARPRVVVERAIGRAKQVWGFLRRRPSAHVLDTWAVQVRVAFMLCNYLGPLTDATSGGLSLQPTDKA